MEAAKVTLYEIFGYTLPGIPLLVAIHFGLAAFGSGNCYFSDSVTFIGGNLLFAYLLGHAAQSIGNVFSSHCEISVLQKNLQKLNESSSCQGIAFNQDLKEAYLVLHNIALTSKYKTQIIDTYIEREGFYRGSLVSSVIAFVILVISFFGRAVTIAVKDSSIVVGGFHKITFTTIVLGLAVAFFFRYKRFLRYRIKAILDATRILIP